MNPMKSKILIVGGAGYIGSHMVLRLAQAGYDVVVFDNLSHGHRDAVLAGELVVGDLADRAMLARLFAAHRFDAVMHFASSIQVGESVQQPACPLLRQQRGQHHPPDRGHDRTRRAAPDLFFDCRYFW